MRWNPIVAFLVACSGHAEERTETVATLPTPPPASTHVAAPNTEGWPCVKPPILTEHQELTLEQMTKSGQPDLVQQAAEIRTKLCTAWAARSGDP
jgi:hypothetical protein